MLSAKDVVKAHKVLSGVVVNTLLDYDHYLSEKYGAKIYLKKENAQRVRSFKMCIRDRVWIMLSKVVKP